VPAWEVAVAARGRGWSDTVTHGTARRLTEAIARVHSVQTFSNRGLPSHPFPASWSPSCHIEAVKVRSRKQ